MAFSPSIVAVANMALSHLGKGVAISSLTENSPAAKQMNLWFDMCRGMALEAFNWSFARKNVALALHGDAAPTNWAYRYALPADCLIVRELENPNGRRAPAVPFEMELSSDGTRSLVTNLESARAIYTFDQTDPNRWSPHFVLVLSHCLAAHAAMAITGKQSIKDAEFQQYYRQLVLAPSHDANQKVDDEPRDAPWIAASGRGSIWTEEPR